MRVIITTYFWEVNSANSRSGKTSFFVITLSPWLTPGVTVGVHCRRTNPTRLSDGFVCRCGTKMCSTHSSTSDQLDKTKKKNGQRCEHVYENIIFHLPLLCISFVILDSHCIAEKIKQKLPYFCKRWHILSETPFAFYDCDSFDS